MNSKILIAATILFTLIPWTIWSSMAFEYSLDEVFYGYGVRMPALALATTFAALWLLWKNAR